MKPSTWLPCPGLRLRAAGLCAASLILSACALPADIPMPPGDSPFDYLLAWIKQYGPLGVLAGLVLLLGYVLINKGFDWFADRLFRRATDAQEERLQERKRQKEMDAGMRAYLDHIFSHHRTLNLRGIRSSQPLSIDLESVYVSLTTQQRSAGEEGGEPAHREGRLPVRGRPLVVSLSDLMPRHTRLVILGDPGAGKTTFLSYLALTYARAMDGRWPALMHERLGYAETLLPIFLPLRDFARHIRLRCENGAIEPGPALLLDFIQQHFAQWSLGLPETFFSEPLHAGRCLVLLDGLDEVANYDERVFVREAVETFVDRFPQNRYVLTCRTGGYRDATRLAKGFHACRVRDFDGEDVKRFALAWNTAVEEAQVGTLNDAVRRLAERKTTSLLNAIQRNPRVRALAINPLMLTVIALVFRYRATLPQRRVELYDECTELLLGHWDMGKEGEEAKDLAEWAGDDLTLDASTKRSILEPVARWYHENSVTEAEQWQVEQLLARRMIELAPTAPPNTTQAASRARTFLGYLKERSGLLPEWEVGRYSFSHLTFQEYLTARDIASEDDYVEQIIRHVEDSWWRETILLTAAHLSTTSRVRASQLVRAILVAGAQRRKNWWDAVILASECLVDIGEYRIDAKVWQDVLAALVWIAEHPCAPLSDRLQALTNLGELGDPRLGSQVVVSGGEYAYRGGASPQTVFVERFEIDRFPVTNHQFREFLRAGGYRTRSYWSEAGWAFMQAEKITQPRAWDDPQWNHPNYPVVGVSWYEAEAYANWADAGLPTEQQWEKAAGGPADKPALSASRWPWGDEATHERANTSELQLDRTTPVGLFSAGVSPCGAQDMAGNVWEWCANSYWQDEANGSAVPDEAGEARALRGGSWRDDLNLASVTSRDRARPTARELDIGFRLIYRQ